MNEVTRALERYLVAAARTGDGAALARLAELRGPRLFAHARRLTDSAEDARDIAQDAWVEILRSFSALREDGAFLPWALRIVTRRAARHVGRRRRDRALSASLSDDAFAAFAPPEGEGATDNSAVRRALAMLPASHLAVMALFYLEEMSVGEVAMALDLPAGTVKTRLMHGREKLRAMLKGDDHGQDRRDDS